MTQSLTLGEGSKNFAMPVLKSGAVSVHPFTGTQGPGLLIDIDFTKPQVKIIATGQIIVIGQTPAGPLYLEELIIDPNFPAFSGCANLQIEVLTQRHTRWGSGVFPHLSLAGVSLVIPGPFAALAQLIRPHHVFCTGSGAS